MQEIRVYNDGELVFTGSMEEWLTINEVNREELEEHCEFLPAEWEDMHSGKWRVEAA